MGSYGNVTGETGRGQGTQAECHSREFGPESSRHQGGPVHGRTYLDVSSESVGARGRGLGGEDETQGGS